MRLSSLFRRRRLEEDLDEELRQHLAREIEHQVALGLSPADARLAALREFGSAAQIADECRDARGLSLVDHCRQDLRYALRLMARNPGFSVAAVLALALGIGVNATVFSVMDAVLLRPLPYPNADRLMILNERQQRGSTISVSWPDYQDWTRETRSFESLAAYTREHPQLTGTGRTELLSAARVSANFFALAGADAALGRLFDASEDRPGADPVIVLSAHFWRSHFHSDPTVIGRGIDLSGTSCTVIGVLADTPSFFESATDLYAPIGQMAGAPSFANRQNHPSIHVLALRRAGVSEASARVDLDSVMQRLEARYPATNRGLRGAVVALAEERLGPIRPVLWLAFAAVALVLLIASVNVANLLLARAVERRKEFAVRAALGAGRGRVVRQMLTESLLLALAGAAGGVLFAALTLKPLLRFAPPLPRIDDVAIDLRVLLFCLAAAALSAILFGVAPAWDSARLNLAESLNDSNRSNSGGRRRLRSWFLVSEVALASLLLLSAAVVTRGLVELVHTDPGFDPNDVQAVQVALQGPRFADRTVSAQFVDTSLHRLRDLPGVTTAGVVACPPLAGDCEDWFYSVSDHPVDSPDRLPIAILNSADAGYFAALRIPLRAGRLFTDTDRQDTTPVVVVNEAFVRRWWRSPAEALGKFVRVEKTRTPKPPAEIIGVVGDTPLDGLGSEVRPEMFFPVAQRLAPHLILLVRTTLDAARVEAEIEAVDNQVPLRTRAMADAVRASLARRRFGATLALTFAALALVLAATGAYGVMSYLVAVRVPELRIRVALGATRRDLVHLVVGHGWRLTLTGVVLGLGAGALASRFLESFLDVGRVLDFVSFAAVAGLFLVVATIASYLPLRRALTGFRR